jgi:phage terminase large subunit
VIDPVRCPLAYEEFRLKEFERDRDGTWVDEMPDGNDHSIDAVRYVGDGRRAEGCVVIESQPLSALAWA